MAESVANSQASEPSLCPVCQTFYGSPIYESMCSKCYKEQQSKLNTESTVSEPVEIVQEAESKPEEVKLPTQEDPKRCFQCTRRVGLMPFLCRCGYTFCSKHRLPLDHSCIYDHHADMKQQLVAKNPTVKPEKFEKI